MAKNWVLHVEKLGKIQQADIEIAPLTLFVGDNNSGKSYLLTLLWGLFSTKEFTSYYNDNSKNYKRIHEWVSYIYDNRDKVFSSDYVVPNEVYNSLVKLINELIDLNKAAALQYIFNYDVKVDKIALKSINREIIDSIIPMVESLSKALDKVKQDIDWKGVFFDVFVQIMLVFVLGYNLTGSPINPLYLPAARTGFTLTYKTLLGEAADDKFNLTKSEKNLLTRPMTTFIRFFTDITSSKNSDTEPNKYSSLIEFIEDSVISGKIQRDNLPISEFFYQPINSDKNIPMYLTSSIVTEMAPLLLALKYKSDFNCIIIEEPELCLHPKLQWHMARVLIRLVNSNIPVIASTHSDVFIQHINNMIKLAKNRNRDTLMRKFGYTQEDIIKDDKICMYQFDVDVDQKTNITKLKSGEFGFIAPTFNSMLEDLLIQSREFE